MIVDLAMVPPGWTWNPTYEWLERAFMGPNLFEGTLDSESQQVPWIMIMYSVGVSFVRK